MSNPIKPCGYRILLKPREVQEKTKGGVFLPDEVQVVEKYAAAVAQVIAMGDQAYDRNDAPWCAIGDWVMIGKHAGHRFKYDGEEYRMINDDEVVALIDDPTKVTTTT